MPINLRIIAIAVFLAVGIHKPEAKQHPMESLGVTLFNTFRSNDFDAFFVRSVFSHNEETFRAFLLSVRNKMLRDNLIALHKMPFPESVKSPTQKWREAFKHNWREQWRHIARKSNREVFNQAFAPILEGARKDGIQWETTQLVASEILLPVTWTNAGFKIKGDNDLEEIIMGFILGEEVVSTVGIPEEETSLIEGIRIAEVLKNSMADKAGLQDNDLILQVDGKDVSSKDHIVDHISSRNPGDLVRIKVRRETLTETSTRNFTLTQDVGTGNPRNLFLDRGCTYRLRLDDLTYAKALMIGLDKQDSEQAYDEGILGNGAGEGDLLIRFGETTPENLFYFCPDQEGAGGKILVKDAFDYNKPNQRTDLLLTFTYGQPTKYYQILVKEVLMTNRGPLFFERPQWIGEVVRPVGIGKPAIP